MFLSNVGPVKIVGGNEYIELISFAEIITKVTNARNAAPDAFQLFQNYPNPVIRRPRYLLLFQDSR